jgi:hypothetical protein
MDIPDDAVAQYPAALHAPYCGEPQLPVTAIKLGRLRCTALAISGD